MPSRSPGRRTRRPTGPAPRRCCPADPGARTRSRSGRPRRSRRPALPSQASDDVRAADRGGEACRPCRRQRRARWRRASPARSSLPGEREGVAGAVAVGREQRGPSRRVAADGDVGRVRVDVDLAVGRQSGRCPRRRSPASVHVYEPSSTEPAAGAQVIDAVSPVPLRVGERAAAVSRPSERPVGRLAEAGRNEAACPGRRRRWARTRRPRRRPPRRVGAEVSRGTSPGRSSSRSRRRRCGSGRSPRPCW